MSRLSKLAVSTALAALGVFAAGCGEGPVDDTNGAVYFSPLENETVAPEKVVDQTRVPQEEIERVKPIVDGFSKGADRLFQREDAAEVLPQIEMAYLISGRYLELVGIYQNVVEEQGISSPAAPRLVRALLRLGQRQQARELIDKLLASQPDSARPWFLNGAYWLPEARDSEDAAARVVASWKKSLAIDPDFDGLEQPNAPSLAQQVEQLEARTSPEALAEARAELDAPRDVPAEAADEDDEAVAEKVEQPEGAPVEEAPAEEPAEQPGAEALAEAATAPTAAAPAPIAPQPAEEPVPVLIARGEMQLAQGDANSAEQLFQKAIERDPVNVTARLGLIRAGWTEETRRAELSKTLRTLAERDDLTPRQQYEIGLFALTKMGDRQLAGELFRKVKERDPQLAETVGIDALLERTQ